MHSDEVGGGMHVKSRRRRRTWQTCRHQCGLILIVSEDDNTIATRKTRLQRFLEERNSLRVLTQLISQQ